MWQIELEEKEGYTAASGASSKFSLEIYKFYNNTLSCVLTQSHEYKSMQSWPHFQCTLDCESFSWEQKNCQETRQRFVHIAAMTVRSLDSLLSVLK